jgi:hypothetical protein
MVSLRKKLIKNRPVPLPGDVYIKRFAVYRVLTYNETDDIVLFATTNDIITIYGNIRRIDIRKNDLYPCPYQLLDAAIQVFRLHETYTQKSLTNLKDYRLRNVKMYEQFRLSELFEDVESAKTRVYIVPDEQGDQFPDLKGKSFHVLVPFMCITFSMYKDRYSAFNLPVDETYHKAIKYSKWPLFYVPSRFE